MAGVSVGAEGHGGRRNLDSEINMIPMIDLLMVTIAFLLITAVWSSTARMNADAQVPGPPSVDTPVEAEKRLHVEMNEPEKFVLVWRQGSTVLGSPIEVARNDAKNVTSAGNKMSASYPDLANRVAEEWKTGGMHRDPSDHARDQVVLHTNDKTEYFKIVGVLDALSQAKRPMTTGGKVAPVSAFNVTFASK